MVACFQAMHAYPVTRLVRVPWNEPGIIGKVLDGGAYGVIARWLTPSSNARRWSPPVATHRWARAAMVLYAPEQWQRRRVPEDRQ